MAATPLDELEKARNLALSDAHYYPTIIPGVLPIVGANSNASLELRRWGAEFLAETFASPIWSADDKQRMALTVLETLKEYLDNVQDRGVVKASVQAAASIYPLVYRHTVSDSSDSHHWQLMVAIKSNILRRMDLATPGVRICCVKFVQQVVLVQTPAAVDPRRPDYSDISLALAPRQHPLIPYASLEAEGQGLLDRLLDIIHGDHSDALLVTAVLNSLGVLIQRRPVVANKIVASVLNFNPLKLANSPMTPKNKVSIRAIERTTRALLVNILKKSNPENPVNPRIQHFLERMNRMRIDIFEEANRKRPAPSEPTDGLDPAKRQRVVGAVVPAPPQPAPVVIPPLPPGPVSYRQLFTLNPEGNTAGFDVQMFKDPEQLLRILVPVLQSIDGTKLLNASNAVRTRYLALSRAAASAPTSGPAADDEEEYEPDFEPEDAEQVVNRLDSLPSTDFPATSAASLAPFKLPEDPPLTQPEAESLGQITVDRVLDMLRELEEKGKSGRQGFNRLAASDYSRDAWITILSRIATRATVGLENPDEGVKDEFTGAGAKGNLSISETIRDGLHSYVMNDWKKRIDAAVTWLNEEWYNETILTQSAKLVAKYGLNGNAASLQVPKSNSNSNYQRCTLRLLDGILPYVTLGDKDLIRFISELPALDYEILIRMKKMAEDPECIDLACKVLVYLHMFRPPVRNIVIDVMAEMWRDNERAKPKASKFLVKWRPEVLQEGAVGDGGEVKTEGNGQPTTNGANTNGTVQVQVGA